MRTGMEKKAAGNRMQRVNEPGRSHLCSIKHMRLSMQLCSCSEGTWWIRRVWDRSPTFPNALFDMHEGTKVTIQHYLSGTPRRGCFPPHVSAFQCRWVTSDRYLCKDSPLTTYFLSWKEAEARSNLFGGHDSGWCRRQLQLHTCTQASSVLQILSPSTSGLCTFQHPWCWITSCPQAP